MAYSASSPELTSLPDTNGGPVGLVWRTAPSDAIQGHVIADQLRTNTARFPNVQKVGILYVDDPYGQGLYNVITARLSAPLSSRGIPYRRRGDVRTALSQLSTYGPDITVLIGFQDDATVILKESSNHPNLLRNTGHRWFFTDGVKDAALLADPVVRDMIQGFYGTAPAQGAGQAFKSFQDRFKARYGGKDPADYAYIANAYDAMYLVALGAAYSQSTSSEVTGVKLAEGLTRVSTGTSGTNTQLTSSNYTFLAAELAAGRSVNIEGASGRLDFDSAGEAPAPIELWQVNAQGFTAIEILEPAP
jgi:branched-chain amino acid transport system substrate-binding protein